MTKERSKRILIISQYYVPEPVQFLADCAHHFAAQGFCVDIITSHPNFPGGRFYPEVKSLWPKWSQDRGVRILRVPIIPNHSRSQLGRFVCYVSYLIVAFFAALISAPRPDYVLVYQTPFTSAIAALPLKYLMGARLVYLCADLWPESLVAAGIRGPSWLVPALQSFSRWINLPADRIIATSPGMAKRYQQDLGSDAHKVALQYLWSSDPLLESEVKKSDKLGTDDHEKAIFVYGGNLGTSQALEVIVKAAKKLDPNQAEFHIYGSGSEEENLRSLAAAQGLTHVHIKGQIPRSQLGLVMRQATAAIVHLADSAMFEYTIPSKLYYCLGIGIPVLAGLRGDALDLVRQAEGVITFKPENADELAAACKKLLSMTKAERAVLGARARQYYDDHFTAEKSVAAVLEHILRT